MGKLHRGRKTGHMLFQRYKDCRLGGLTHRTRRPYRHANRLPFQIDKLIVQLKREASSTGPSALETVVKPFEPKVSLQSPG